MGEAFREPLVAIGCPSHQMAPPLMRHFMRRHFVNEVDESERIAAQQRPALCFVQKCAHGQVHQRRPGLPEAEFRLLRDRDSSIRQRTEPKCKEANGIEASTKALWALG